MRTILVLSIFICLLALINANEIDQQRITLLNSKRVITETGIKRAATDLEGQVIAEAEDAAVAEQRSMLSNEQKLSNAILAHNADAQQILASNPALQPQLHAITDVTADLLLAKGIATKLAKKEKIGNKISNADIRKLRTALGFNKKQFKSIKKEANAHGWNKVAKAFTHITKGFEKGVSKAFQHKARASKVRTENTNAATLVAQAAVKNMATAQGLYDDTEWTGRLLDDKPNAALLKQIQELANRYGLTHLPVNMANLPEEVKNHPLVRDGHWIPQEKDHKKVTPSSPAAVNLATLKRRQEQLKAYEAKLAAREAIERRREQLFAKKVLQERVRRALANAYVNRLPYGGVVSSYPAFIQEQELITPSKPSTARLVKPKIAGVDALTPEYKDM